MSSDSDIKTKAKSVDKEYAKKQRELKRLFELGTPDPNYKRVTSGSGWKYIPIKEYEANKEKHDKNEKIRELNNAKPKKSKS